MKVMMKTIAGLLVLIGLSSGVFAQMGGSGSEPADEQRYSFGVSTVGYWQALSQSNDNGSLPDLATGFQSAAGNLHFNAQVTEGVELYFEIYLSSRHHEGYLMPREGFITVTSAPGGLDFAPVNRLFDFINVKAGHFEIDFGNAHLRRSDNAEVQRNPLVGNDIVDPNVVYVGAEVSTKPARFNALVGVTNGQTTGDLQDGHQYAFHGKVWGDVIPGIKVAGSFYRGDQSANPIGYPVGGSFGNLFSGNRSGGRYSAVLNGGGEPGQVLPGNGQDETAWQGDLEVAVGDLTLQGHYGNIVDADVDGTNPADPTTSGHPKEDWDYYSAQAVYQLGSNLYAALRLSGANAKLLSSAASDGKVQRVQAGFGYWVGDGILLKVEYVSQTYSDFGVGTAVDRLAVGLNPKFSGVITEVSVSI